MKLTTQISLLSLASLALLSACRQNNYYCDATGCYYCDGLGCEEIEPPDREPCLGNFECGDAECTDIGCVDTCADESDCPEGTACRAGLCLNPSEPDPTPNPGDCTQGADCATGFSCVDGLCQPGGPSTCDDATRPCAEGAVCIDGSCRQESDVCRFNSQCGAGRVCLNGECTSRCDDAACPEGQSCQDNLCVSDPLPTDECVSNDACGAGQICVNGACLEGCANHEACGEGRFCDEGVCRVDTSPRPFCDADSDCRDVCVYGSCRLRCETSTECAGFDAQFQFCVEDTELSQNFCGTTNEATSNCSLSADCASGQACIDGVCRS